MHLCGTGPIAQAIHRVIARTPLKWSTRIGLHGSWGTGKTTVLNYLQQIAEKNGDIVVRFSAWSAGGEGGIIAQFYDALNSELGNRQIEVPPALKAKSAARWALRKTKPATEVAESAADIAGLGKLL